MMYQKGTFGYAGMPQLSAHVIELPYGNEDRLSMYILLPQKGEDILYERKNFSTIFFSRCDPNKGY